MTTGYAPINGAQLYYEVTGDGPAVIFLHAGVADSRAWDDQIPVFARKYRAVRYDLRGYGKSEPVEGEYTHHNDLLALMDYLSIERAALIGNSMGGGAALNLTLLRPERVLALALVGSAPDDLELDVAAPPLFSEAEAAWKAGDYDLMAEIEARIWFDGEGRTPDQADPARRAYMREMNRLALAHAARRLGKPGPPLEPGSASRLHEVSVPVLVLLGALDIPYMRAAADIMIEKIPNARQVIMENTAHLPGLEHPEAFNQIVLDFLADAGVS